MKLKTTTIILIMLALGLGIFVYFVEIKGKHKTENVENNTTNSPVKLFNFTDEEIKTLVIEIQGKTLKFEHTEDTTKPWQMIQPENVTASDASVSFLVNLFKEASSNQNFVITKEQLIDYGLDKPIAKILIELKNAEKHEIILGKPNFDNTLIYAQIDSDKEVNESPKIVLISKSFQYAVERNFEDWKQPLNK